MLTFVRRAATLRRLSKHLKRLGLEGSLGRHLEPEPISGQVPRLRRSWAQRVTSDYSIRLEYEGQNEGNGSYRQQDPAQVSTAPRAENSAQHLGPGNVSNERTGNPANLSMIANIVTKTLTPKAPLIGEGAEGVG
jgi:hypothetical protein